MVTLVLFVPIAFRMAFFTKDIGKEYKMSYSTSSFWSGNTR
jgi:hypothetical protein